MSGAIPLLPNAPSWSDVQLKSTGAVLPLPYLEFQQQYVYGCGILGYRKKVFDTT